MSSIFTTFPEFASNFDNQDLEPGQFVAFAVGVFLLIKAILISRMQIRHRWQSMPVNVEVIDLRERADSDGDLFYLPTFRISDGLHKGVEWESHYGADPAPHNIGEFVRATYNPESGVIQSQKTSLGSWIMAAAMLFFAGLCFWLSRQF